MLPHSVSVPAVMPSIQAAAASEATAGVESGTTHESQADTGQLPAAPTAPPELAVTSTTGSQGSTAAPTGAHSSPLPLPGPSHRTTSSTTSFVEAELALLQALQVGMQVLVLAEGGSPTLCSYGGEA
jgi:hypothetical protein